MGQINPKDEKWKAMYSGGTPPKPANTQAAQPVAMASNAAPEPVPAKLAAPEVAPAPAPAAIPKTPPAAATAAAQAPAAPIAEADVINFMNDNMRDVFINRINEELEENGYQALGGASIDGISIDFAGIAESDTIVLGILNLRHGDIIANETPTSPELAPSWYTAEQKYDSPVWEVRTAAAAAAAMINEVLPEDNDIKVVPVVVIPNATVANKADIEKKWEEAGVAVVRFMNYSDLPDLAQALPDKKGTEVLPSFRKFAETLVKYFAQKARRAPIRKTG
jgi:hypothetical protein